MQPLKTMLFVCRRHVIRIFRCACYMMNYSNSTKKMFWHFPSTNAIYQALHNLLTTTYMVFLFSFFPWWTIYSVQFSVFAKSDVEILVIENMFFCLQDLLQNQNYCVVLCSMILLFDKCFASYNFCILARLLLMNVLH